MLLLLWDVLTTVFAQDVAAYEPKTLIGLLGLLIAVAIPAVAAGIPGWISLWRSRSVAPDLAETKDSVAAVRDQVQNGHADRKLRDDVDRVLAGLGDIMDKQDHQGRDIRGLRDDMGQMRGELRDERETRASADSAHETRASANATQVAALGAAVAKLQEQLDRPRAGKPPDNDDGD